MWQNMENTDVNSRADGGDMLSHAVGANSPCSVPFIWISMYNSACSIETAGICAGVNNHWAGETNHIG